MGKGEAGEGKEQIRDMEFNLSEVAAEQRYLFLGVGHSTNEPRKTWFQNLWIWRWYWLAHMLVYVIYTCRTHEANEQAKAQCPSGSKAGKCGVTDNDQRPEPRQQALLQAHGQRSRGEETRLD